MDILPAIDLLEGSCVRLIQGRYDRVIDYQANPIEVATRFHEDGAEWTHVIDLDGARQGSVANIDALRQIVTDTGLKVQFGGGVREQDDIKAALDAGATRVIVGTRALEDWDWFRDIVHKPEFAGRISLGLDAKLGRLEVQGWTPETERTSAEVAEEVSGWPLATIVYTDIARDGLMLGPNLDAIRVIANTSAIPVVYCGGVTDLDDVRRMSELKLSGVVIGRAIYENAIALDEAIKLASPEA